MTKIVFILCCFLCVQDEPIISWDETYKLGWDNFRASPNHQESAAAITASGITFGFSIKRTNARVVSFTSDVHAHFYPEQSWYKKDIADTHVLRHEQLHFDITELYARKFRQRINQLSISNNLQSALKNIHNNINEELEQLQGRYDEETDYSRNFEAQAKWQAYITGELKKLSKYKSVK